MNERKLLTEAVEAMRFSIELINHKQTTEAKVVLKETLASIEQQLNTVNMQPLPFD